MVLVRSLQDSDAVVPAYRCAAVVQCIEHADGEGFVGHRDDLFPGSPG
jgi:hypothetical protein